jgi:hypothetical protein
MGRKAKMYDERDDAVDALSDALIEWALAPERA